MTTRNAAGTGNFRAIPDDGGRDSLRNGFFYSDVTDLPCGSHGTVTQLTVRATHGYTIRRLHPDYTSRPGVLHETQNL